MRYDSFVPVETFGHYQLESLIAAGGLGEVWRARRSGEGERVAVKRMHTHLARNADACAMFALEQRLALELPRHRNVVYGSDAADVAGRAYVALELIEGDDLRRVLAPSRPGAGAATPVATLPRARVLAIAADACAAAAHLHAAGYVHGDICPSNLVIEAQPSGDRTVLVDLGVARRIGEGGVVRGTHAYMAPEQVRGQAWTPATDVFAIGVIVWELVASARLFHRGPPWLTLAAVIEEPVPALPDRALDAVIQRALAKDPAARIASAAELGALLAGAH